MDFDEDEDIHGDDDDVLQTQQLNLVDNEDDDQTDANNNVRPRNLYFHPQELAANCFAITEPNKRLLSKHLSDGSTFTFVSKMTSTAALPPETLQQILAVCTVLFSEDTTSDIINDSTLQTKIEKNVITSCCESVKRGRSGDGTAITTLWEMDNYKILEMQKELMHPVHGKRKTQDFIDGTDNMSTKPMRNGRLFVTIHEVKYETSQRKPDSFFAAVLWVVCHRNFDFTGKLSRLFEDPNKWRKPHINNKARNKAQEIDTTIMEETYQLWCNVLEHQGQLMCLGHACRDTVGDKSADAVRNILEIYDADSFIVNTCPMMAHVAICNMAPAGSRNICVEGMDAETAANSWGMCVRQYLERFRAFRIQYRRFKLEELKRQQEKSNKRQANADENADDEAADNIPEMHFHYDQLNIVGIKYFGDAGKAEFVESCLAGTADATNEHGRANLPYMPAWPVDYDAGNNMIIDDVPRCSIRLAVDLKTLAPVLASIIQTLNTKEFNVRFGDIPQTAREHLESKTFAAVAGGEDVRLQREENDSIQMTQFDRRNVHDRTINPKKSILENMSYADEMRYFLRASITTENAAQNIARFHGYVDRMFYTMENDIICGKAHSKVFESTQSYLKSVDTTAVKAIRGVLHDHLHVVGNFTGSDFEINHCMAQEIFEHCNCMFWGLEPQNMLIMNYFLLSELAWRCGTFGNWMWIGMTVQISDGGGLTKTMCNGVSATNLKKSGTAGYDLCRNVFNAIRTMYKFVVPSSVLKQFPEDDHIDKGSARMTPGSVAEGTIVLLDGKMTKGPADVGKVKHFPEGFGDLSVINALVPVIPRDKNAGFILSSTADVNNNNLRQKMTTISVDGVAITIGTCAQNQTPELQTLLRQEDLMRVFSVVATSGPSQRAPNKKLRVSKKDEKSSFAGACFPGGSKGRIFAQSNHMTDKQAQQMAPFFSIAFLMASRAALAQKYGVLNWDISPPVNFLLQTCYQKITGLLNPLISPSRIEHTNRVFDTAKLLVGISKTALTRTYTHSCYEQQSTVDSVVKAVFREQHLDALHFSFVPAVLMRYLVSTLDFQTLAVLQMLIHHAKIPQVSMVSAAQFLRGQHIDSDADREALKKYIDAGVANKLFGKQMSFGEGNFDEGTNMDYYVTVEREEKKRTPLRMGFIRQEAQNKDEELFKKDRLKKNCVSCLKTDAVKYAMFCKDYPHVPIELALDRMFVTEYDLGGFFGGFDLFQHPQRLFRTLFDAQDRFAGMPETEPHASMLRVLTMDSGDIALGLNFPSAVFLQALMENAGCDWELQMTMAKNIVSFLFENVIPYSLFPSDYLFLDSYVKNARVEELKVKVNRKQRPLTIARNEQNAIPRVVTERTRVIEGGSTHGLFEDTAHMYTIITMAEEMRCPEVNMLYLTSWDFEVWWGNPGDVTPLQRYKVNPQHVDAADGLNIDSLCAGDGKRAFVKVDASNALELFVRQPDGVVHSVVLRPSDTAQRALAQKFLFGLGWGPAPKWRRVSVVFCNENNTLSTLVPLNFESITDEVLYEHGVNQLQWFDEKEMCYTALDGEGRISYVATEYVQKHMLKHGECVLVQTTTDALDGLGFAPEDSRNGYVQAYVVTENANFPELGMVAVAIRCANDTKFSDTFLVPVEDLCKPETPEEFYSYYRCVTPSLQADVPNS